MAVSADPYDPWNATLQSAAAGAGWRADVRRADADSGGLLNLDRTERASQFEYLVRDQMSETPQEDFTATTGGGSAGDGADSGTEADEEGWFDHALDIINPLQHIPVVSTVYRELSGDEISHFSRVAGGTLFFGPLGTLSALANVAVEETTGKDVGEHVMALFENIEADPVETVADAGAAATPFTNPDAAAAPEAIDPATSDPLAVALLSQQQSLASAASAAAEPIRVAQATPAGGDQALPLAAMPPEILEALHAQGAARPLSPNGFAFADAPLATASATTAAPPPPTDVSLNEVTATARADALASRVVLDTQADREALNEAVASRPAGSTATEGGWFSSAMLKALNHYETTQSLTARPAVPSVDVAN